MGELGEKGGKEVGYVTLLYNSIILCSFHGSTNDGMVVTVVKYTLLYWQQWLDLWLYSIPDGM